MFLLIKSTVVPCEGQNITFVLHVFKSGGGQCYIIITIYPCAGWEETSVLHVSQCGGGQCYIIFITKYPCAGWEETFVLHVSQRGGGRYGQGHPGAGGCGRNQDNHLSIPGQLASTLWQLVGYIDTDTDTVSVPVALTLVLFCWQWTRIQWHRDRTAQTKALTYS